MACTSAQARRRVGEVEDKVPALSDVKDRALCLVDEICCLATPSHLLLEMSGSCSPHTCV